MAPEEGESMDWLLKVAVAVVVLTPIVLFFLLVALAHLMPSPPVVARASFVCPVTRRRVNAAFLTMEGTSRPVDIVACSAFPNPERVRCAKACLAAASTMWTPSPMTARYALLAGCESYRGSAPEIAASPSRAA